MEVSAMPRESTHALLQFFRRDYRPRVKDHEAPYPLCSDSGSSLVEFALSASILMTLVFGVMVMSMALYSYHFISEAAREGTRYAMVRGSSCSTYGKFTTGCGATPAQIQTYVQGLGFPGITAGNMTVTTTWPTTGAACTPTAIPCNNPGNLVKVVVSYQFPLTIPFVPARTLTMTSSSQMVISD
jgi:Flp pilus assembly protein TadG